MLVTFLKWVLLPIVLVFTALSVTGGKTVREEILIPALPEKVWSVLMASDNYSEWNPVFKNVKGEYRQGANVEHTLHDPDGGVLEIEAYVETLEPNRLLRQTGGIWSVITFDHSWILEPVDGGTKATQYEVYTGAYMWFWDSDWIDPSYAQVNEALRDRVLASGN